MSEGSIIFGYYSYKPTTYEEAYIKALNYTRHILKHKGILVLNCHQRTCKYMRPLGELLFNYIKIIENTHTREYN